MSTEALYQALRMHTAGECYRHIHFHPARSCANSVILAEEYSFVLSIVMILRIMTKYAPEEWVHVNLHESDDTVHLSVHIRPTAVAPLLDAFERLEDMLADIISRAHLDAELNFDDGLFAFRLSAPVYKVAPPALRAQDMLIAKLLARVFREVHAAIP